MSCLEVARNQRFCEGAEEYMKQIAELEAQVEELEKDLLDENDLFIKWRERAETAESLVEEYKEALIRTMRRKL